jgi:transposase
MIDARQGLDRKTVRKYLKRPSGPYPQRAARGCKSDAYLPYLRERWEQGVHNTTKPFPEVKQRGYQGGSSQLRALVGAWRSEERERAFARYETGPGEQAQMDWGTLGRFEKHRLYAFALTLSYSRMRYVEFTQRQDAETLLSCLVHAFRYFGGVPQSVLTDNMKTVVLDRRGGVIHWNPRFLDFASYYGFLPRVCQPYRPETKGKVESTIRFVKRNFLAGDQLRLTYGSESAGTGVDGGGQWAGEWHDASHPAPALGGRETASAGWAAGLRHQLCELPGSGEGLPAQL